MLFEGIGSPGLGSRPSSHLCNILTDHLPFSVLEVLAVMPLECVCIHSCAVNALQILMGTLPAQFVFYYYTAPSLLTPAACAHIKVQPALTLGASL